MAKKSTYNREDFIKKYHSPLIKWYMTNISKEDKFRLGLMTYPEYIEWQQELEAQARAEAGSDTFWKGDTENRENLSEDDYESFLAQNSIDVSNKSAVDFDALAAQLEEEARAQIVELTPEEILANVNKDIHGGNCILSQDEIEALFKAYNGG